MQAAGRPVRSGYRRRAQDRLNRALARRSKSRSTSAWWSSYVVLCPNSISLISRNSLAGQLVRLYSKGWSRSFDRGARLGAILGILDRVERTRPRGIRARFHPECGSAGVRRDFRRRAVGAALGACGRCPAVRRAVPGEPRFRQTHSTSRSRRALIRSQGRSSSSTGRRTAPPPRRSPGISESTRRRWPTASRGLTSKPSCRPVDCTTGCSRPRVWIKPCWSFRRSRPNPKFSGSAPTRAAAARPRSSSRPRRSCAAT
jgi:hypothetical protein